MVAQELVELKSAGLTAAIERHGAQLQSLRTAAGRELIWPGDPVVWPDHAPILFPVIGPLEGGRFRHQGRDYPMPPHGFARLRDFAVMERSPGRVVFELRDDAETRAQYPFAFRLQATFELADAALQITIAVDNLDREILPADVGFHPGFNWPLTPGHDKADYRLVFERAEPAPIRRGTGDPTRLVPGVHPTPVEGNILPLHDQLFAESPIVFDRLNSRSVTFGAPGSLSLRVGFPDCPYLALWMKPGARFLAIEPWQGLPSQIDFAGPFVDKPGIARLAPGETRCWRLDITPQAGADE